MQQITSCARRPHPWAGTGCRGTGPNTCAHSLAGRQCSRIPSGGPQTLAGGPPGQNGRASSSAAPFFPARSNLPTRRAAAARSIERTSTIPAAAGKPVRATASMGRRVGATEIAGSRACMGPVAPYGGELTGAAAQPRCSLNPARAPPRRRTYQLYRLLRSPQACTRRDVAGPVRPSHPRLNGAGSGWRFDMPPPRQVATRLSGIGLTCGNNE